ncbi:MAG: hypothetical protein WCK89_24000 [bacterium]
MKVKLCSWPVPNYVLPDVPAVVLASGWYDRVKFPIGDASQRELSDLCDKFRADVFKAAGMPDPRPPGSVKYDWCRLSRKWGVGMRVLVHSRNVARREKNGEIKLHERGSV